MKKDFPGTIRINLHRSDPDKTTHVIETIRRMETNTSLYAAGAFAPLLVLINQLPYLQGLPSFEKKLALISMGLFAVSGIFLVLHRAFYSNLKRTQVELFKAGVKSNAFKALDAEKHTLVAFESGIWFCLVSIAFLAMPIGWVTMGWLATRLLTGN